MKNNLLFYGELPNRTSTHGISISNQVNLELLSEKFNITKVIENVDLSLHEKRNLRKIKKKIFFNFSHGVFLYGEYAKKNMIVEDIKPDKLHVIYNSLNYDSHILLRDKINKEKFFNNNYQTLIFIGRLTKVKKINLLLESLKYLKSKETIFNLIIIGDGDIKKDLINLCEEYNIVDQVIFIGELYEENEISKYLYNADLCVSPGNVGLTAIHSMTFGTPVITHNNFKNQMPEFEAIIQGKTGDFFIENDAIDLSNKIFNWINNNKNNREKIRKECYEVILEKYNPYYQIKLLKEVIK